MLGQTRAGPALSYRSIPLKEATLIGAAVSYVLVLWSIPVTAPWWRILYSDVKIIVAFQTRGDCQAMLRDVASAASRERRQGTTFRCFPDKVRPDAVQS